MFISIPYLYPTNGFSNNTVPGNGTDIPTFSLGGLLDPDNQPTITTEQLHYVATCDTLSLAVNFFDLFYQVWQLGDFEVVRRPLTFIPKPNPLITMTFSAIQGAHILPRTDHMMWALYAIFVRTFIYGAVMGEERDTYDWQVSKNEDAFMNIETKVVRPSNIDGHANIASNASLGIPTAASNSTLGSELHFFVVEVNYSSDLLSAEDLILIMRHLILGYMKYEPEDYMRPGMRQNEISIMSVGQRSYQGQLDIIIPDPEAAQSGEHMVHFIDIVGGLRKLLFQLASVEDSRCFKASILGFTGSSMVPFATLEIKPLVAGFGNDNRTTLDIY